MWAIENQKSKIKNDFRSAFISGPFLSLITRCRALHHRHPSRPAPILVSRAQGVQGFVSLDSTIAFLDNFATPDGPALLPLSPLGTASGISSFSGLFSGTCGKTGGRGYMSGRIVFLVNSQPFSEASARHPTPDARSPKPRARSPTQHSELGTLNWLTNLQTYNLQLTTVFPQVTWA
jgi:hypothetical protein